MSSFSNPHYMYLFNLKNGKKKLAYGESPEDALEILSYRLAEQEMALINKDEYLKKQLGEELVDTYTEKKKEELNNYLSEVSDVDIKYYLHC